MCGGRRSFVAAELKRIGMEHVEVIETSTDESVIAGASGPAQVVKARIGHPMVYADWLHAPGKPTILCYGHYDVQPAEPLEEWLSPPFEPTERNGNLYARGAVDDKGQMWMHVKALEALMVAGGGTLPVNVRVIVEGEEEVGGEGIATFVKEHGERLKADIALVSDTDMFAPDLPTLTVGLRGMIYTEVEVRGARTDLHSGMYGGAAPNPFIALAQIIAKLKDEDGRILIPGIYDQVARPTDAELAAWKTLPFNEEEYRDAQVGSLALTGEPEFGVLERLWARPTLEVHGMPGGFIGAGAKTVIPAKATAKLSMRLVPDMTPADTFARLKAIYRGDRAARLHDGGADDPLGRPDCGGYGQPLCGLGDGGDARGLRQGDGVCARRRVDSDHRRLWPRARHSDADDGLRPAG